MIMRWTEFIEEIPEEGNQGVDIEFLSITLRETKV
jgi:hypothetical protein